MLAHCPLNNSTHLENAEDTVRSSSGTKDGLLLVPHISKSSLSVKENDFSNMSPVDKESFGTIENSAEEILMNEKTFDVENMQPEEMAKELKRLDTAYKKKLYKEQKY